MSRQRRNFSAKFKSHGTRQWLEYPQYMGINHMPVYEGTNRPWVRAIHSPVGWPGISSLPGRIPVGKRQSTPTLTEHLGNAMLSSPTAMGIRSCSGIPSVIHFRISPATCQGQAAGTVAAFAVYSRLRPLAHPVQKGFNTLLFTDKSAIIFTQNKRVAPCVHKANGLQQISVIHHISLCSVSILREIKWAQPPVKTVVVKYFCNIYG